MFSCLVVASVARFIMELSYFINLIFIFVLDILFFVSGTCLNSLVMLSFWRSSQLRKKLCYFMIMVLSCCGFVPLSFSLLALLVMNFDRYLATYYPIFYRTSVAKGKLLILLAILSIPAPLLQQLPIKGEASTLYFFYYCLSPNDFHQLQIVHNRKEKSQKKITQDEKHGFFVSSCLLAAACFVVLSIPWFVYIRLGINSKETMLSDNGNLARLCMG